MNTLEINQILTKDKVSRQHFLGVFARDRLPKIVNYPASLVFNTDDSDKPGMHWIAIYFSSKNRADYFDSLGENPQKYGVDKYLFENSSHFQFNNTKIQSDFSNYCGLYSILFIYLKSRGNTMDKIINHFQKIKESDKYLENFLKKL